MAKKKSTAAIEGGLEIENGIVYQNGFAIGKLDPGAKASPAQVAASGAASPLTTDQQTPQAPLPIGIATPLQPTSAITPFASPKKGPSLAGPTTSGWTAGNLTPQATVTTTLPPPGVAPPPGGTTGTSDLSQYNLTPEEFGIVPNLRVTKPQTTPLEQLLAQMFPDAAADYNPQEIDPFADPRAKGPQASLLGTILGNLGAQPTAAPPPQYLQAPLPGAVPNIPGAPPFLQGAMANLQNGYVAPPVPVAGGNSMLTLAGVSAIAAEQRKQQADMLAAQKQAETDYFQQQQQKQKAQAMVAQRQRQRFGAVSAGTSGWSTSPLLY